MGIILGEYNQAPLRDFCARMSIMLLTDLPSQQIKETVNMFRSRRPNAAVMGISLTQMESLLKHYAILIRILRPKKPIPLKHLSKIPYAIVNVSNHYVALSHGKIADTFVPWFVPLSDHPYGQARAKTVYILGDKTAVNRYT